MLFRVIASASLEADNIEHVFRMLELHFRQLQERNNPEGFAYASPLTSGFIDIKPDDGLGTLQFPLPEDEIPNCLRRQAE
jgi:hypothetical protein